LGRGETDLQLLTVFSNQKETNGMAKYKVVRPIDYNNTLYLPAGAATTISVDNSGTIELTAQAAALFTNGQIAPLTAGPDFMPTPIKQ
jgi:hypothetical protein